MTTASTLSIAFTLTVLVALPAKAQEGPAQGQAPQATAGTTGQRGGGAASAGTLTTAAQGRSLQAFAVTLVIADMQPGGTQDDVPAAARKALADLKDFLPYKSYRLVDAQWIRSNGAAVETRIKGPDQEEYGLRISGGQQSATVIVRFVLRAPGAVRSASSASVAQLMLREAQLKAQYAEEKQKVEVGMVKPDAARAIERDLQVLELELEQTRAGDATAMMDASFRMDLDETVVVGTSRIKGDKALIALLTAVGTKAPAAREP